jgi:hypothetical protein
MGSSSIGRRGGKRMTTDLWTLDVRKVQRESGLEPGETFGCTWRRRGGEVIASVDLKAETDRVMLNYRQKTGGDWQARRYPVEIAWTACHYGGQRAWWLCPGKGCGRRVALLYGGLRFECRHCHDLAYKSQRQTSDDRAFQRVDQLRARLGWGPGIIHAPGGKPKGMHWRTFWRLHARYDASVIQALGGESVKLDKVMTELKHLELKMAQR